MTKSRIIGRPSFAQPEPTADPSTFRVPHPSDSAAYKKIDELNRLHKIKPLPFPQPRGGAEPLLELVDILGGDQKQIQQILKNKQIVFHSTGDCGSTRGPQTQDAVVQKMLSDFEDPDIRERPQFHLLLGDIVYNFGESQYYFDQFYEPYRNYPAPILAVAGNHDGMISPLAHAESLKGFLRNFCASDFEISPDAGGLNRTAQIQPGVFFTFDAPFVRIICLYSNTLEDPGVIASPEIGNSQLTYLKAALTRVKQEKFSGALLFAAHHPPYTAGSQHGWSIAMNQQIDEVCAKVGVWPHAFLTGHAHNYQRFTRTRPDGSQIPYIICGNGGHNVMRLTHHSSQQPLRAPQIIQSAAKGKDQVVFENYDDQNYGYLRILCCPQQLRIEYHSATNLYNNKSSDDNVTVDLSQRKIAHYRARDLGYPERARKLRSDVRR